jgi:hypothetical protein
MVLFLGYKYTVGLSILREGRRTMKTFMAFLAGVAFTLALAGSWMLFLEIRDNGAVAMWPALFGAGVMGCIAVFAIAIDAARGASGKPREVSERPSYPQGMRSTSVIEPSEPEVIDDPMLVELEE